MVEQGWFKNANDMVCEALSKYQSIVEDSKKAAKENLLGETFGVPLDISELVNLIMQQLSNEEEELLRQLMAELHAQNGLKKKQRKYIDRMKQAMKRARKEIAREYKSIRSETGGEALPASRLSAIRWQGKVAAALGFYSDLQDDIDTHNMDDDIRMIMAEIKAMNGAKQKLRETQKKLNQWIQSEMHNHASSEDIQNEAVLQPGPASGEGDLDRTDNDHPIEASQFWLIQCRVHRLEDQIDSLSELLDLLSLSLQMMMDRRSKNISSLSNILKKLGTTMESQVQNMK
jgi:hypothetical protein